MFSEEEGDDGVCRSRWNTAAAQMGRRCIFKLAKCVLFFFARRALDQIVLSTQCCVIPANSQIICLPARSAVSVEPQKPFSYSKLLNCCASVCVCAVMDESGGILPSPPLRQAAEIVWHDVIPRVQSKLCARTASLIRPRLHRVRRRRKVEGGKHRMCLWRVEERRVRVRRRRSTK